MWSSSVFRRVSALAMRSVAATAVIGLAFSLLGTGCGDDVEIYQPPKDDSPYLQQTSPENVLHNFATSYSTRDYKGFLPLVREDFTFFFSPDAYGSVGVPREGFWGYAEELDATQRMFNPFYNPKAPEFKIQSISMALTLSGPLKETSVEGAPRGTLEAFVALDLRIRCVEDSFVFFVQSRPRFYFAPDSTRTPPVWQLWRCDDELPDDSALDLDQGSVQSWREDQGGCGVEADRPSRRETPAGISAVTVTWGELKAFYRTGSR
jgi:hypothetical protein